MQLRQDRPEERPGDSIDRIMADWERVRPDLDTSASPVIARLARVQQVLNGELEAPYIEYGLNSSDFAALVTLYRFDNLDGMSQSALMRELAVTPGTISVRVDRLCARGLVTRVPDPHDRRSSRVTLTDAGRVLFERVTPGYLATEKRLLTALSDEQLDTLAVILRQLLVAFEGSTRDGTLPRLGLTLASSHHTVTMRRAVGLPEVVGLLVRDVERGSRADHADIAVGDVVVRAGGRELRSVTALYTALADASGEDTMTVSAVRGLDTAFEATLDLRPGQWDGPPVAQESTGGDAGTHIV